MRKDNKFVDMIVAFLMVGISAIAFFVLLINYEIQKPNLPTPTPIVSKPMADISSTPTPTPGYTKLQWGKLFRFDDKLAYDMTEEVTDSEGKVMVNRYKAAGNAGYYFNQTGEETAIEGWNIVKDNDYYFVDGNLVAGEDHIFAVDGKGYKIISTDKSKLAEKNKTFFDKATSVLIKYHREIPYDRFDCVTPCELYKTGADDKYQVTIKIADGKITEMEMVYTDDADSEAPKTVKITIEVNSISKEDIINSCPIKEFD